MWPFSKKPSLEELRGYKKLSIHGWNFVIKRINPLIDFPEGKMPQIFSAFMSKRQKRDGEHLTEAELNKIEEEMKVMIEAGLVEPKLSPRAKRDEGITVDDLFRDEEIAAKLYWEILIHSLNKFKGLRGFFISIRIRFLLFTLLRKSMGSSLQKFVLKWGS